MPQDSFLEPPAIVGALVTNHVYKPGGTDWVPVHSVRFRGKVCHCGACQWSVGLLIGPSGQRKNPWFCVSCGSRTAIYEPKHASMIYTRVWREDAAHECEVCGKSGAEWHHWMPKHLAGEEAEKWPMGLLCQSCHAQWHQVVTPGMGTNHG